VAESDGKIVGHVIAQIESVPPVYVITKQVYVVELFVKENLRGRGIGTRLLEEIEKWARQRKLWQFSLTANTKNLRARKVYSKFGLMESQVKMVKLLD
jgi:GNAT superfamily N-acetyltransferase